MTTIETIDTAWYLAKAAAWFVLLLNLALYIFTDPTHQRKQVMWVSVYVLLAATLFIYARAAWVLLK